MGNWQPHRREGYKRGRSIKRGQGSSAMPCHALQCRTNASVQAGRGSCCSPPRTTRCSEGNCRGRHGLGRTWTRRKLVGGFEQDPRGAGTSLTCRGMFPLLTRAQSKRRGSRMPSKKFVSGDRVSRSQPQWSNPCASPPRQPRLKSQGTPRLAVESHAVSRLHSSSALRTTTR